MNILIVEDDYISSIILEDILKDYGKCEIIYEGVKALEYIKNSINNSSKNIDLIVLDIMMPDLDGITILKEIRDLEENLSIPKKDRLNIIIQTAVTDNITKEEAMKNGSNDFLLKPIEPEDLRNVIKKYLI